MILTNILLDFKILKVSKEAKLLYQELCNIVKDKISVKLINVYSSRTNLHKIQDLRDRKCIGLTDWPFKKIPARILVTF